LSKIGLVGLAVMGQNLALNIAEKGFPISVWNRSPAKMHDAVARAKAEGDLALTGYEDLREFVDSLERPRRIIMLVKAGAPVDATIARILPLLEPDDILIDGGNEWFPNTERRAKDAAALGIHYMGMGVSGGEEGARNGPSLMPGGPREAYDLVAPILEKVAAQVGGPCVTYIGPGGSGNYVKMVHNGIEYGDMQLIAEAYDVLRLAGGLSNDELAAVFADWNAGELESFLIEITAQIFRKRDGDGYLVDAILDKTGMKGTGRMTVQEAAEKSVPAATISAALDGRYLSGLKDERVAASRILTGPTPEPGSHPGLVDDVRNALYAAKICSYAQGMNLIRAASEEYGWDLDLGSIARIWKGGCIIRAAFLDRIKQAYDADAALKSLLVDPSFASELTARQGSWRRVVGMAVASGIPVPGLSGSLAYFDAYRRERLPANLVQAQRDLFGAHTFERVDRDGSFHADWDS